MTIRTLVLDIETGPHMAYVWKIWDETIPLQRLIESGTVLCFAAKWLDERKMHFYSDFHDGHEAMVEAAWKLIDEADAVIHYNGRSFDMKHLQREFVLAGMPPPSPHRDIDLLQVVRHKFKFVSSKLDHVARELGLGGKLDAGGFDVWIGCMQGDEKSWRKMRRYNIGDVRLTEALYRRLLPWIDRHPNVALYVGADRACPKCGAADDLTRWGFLRTNAGSFRRYRCGSCGAYSRDAKRTETTELREAV